MQLATDEAGVLRFEMAPGTYRLASSAPAQWRGRSYRWNVPLVVKRGMGLVELTNANVAGTNVEVVSRNGDVSSDAIAFKDPTLATILIAMAGNDARDYNASRHRRVSVRPTLDRGERRLALTLALSY